MAWEPGEGSHELTDIMERIADDLDRVVWFLALIAALLFVLIAVSL